ncbi:MAG: hypothetical protein AAF608_04975 [Pseudomonadota bacterium]
MTETDAQSNIELIEKLQGAIDLMRSEYPKLNITAVSLFLLIASNERETYQFFIKSTGWDKVTFTRYVSRLTDDAEQGAGLITRQLLPGASVERIVYLTGKGRALSNRLAEMIR